MSELGAKVNFVALEGGGWSGRLQALKGAVARELDTTASVDVSTLSLSVAPEGTRDPAADRVATISLSCAQETGEMLCCLVIDDAVLPFGSPPYEAFASLLASMTSWDCGYGFTGDFRHAEFHVLGLDPGDLPDVKYRSLCKWYDADLNARATLLRDIYPYNFLNSVQIESLNSAVQRPQESVLERVEGSNLYLWRVSESERDLLRRPLIQADMLFAAMG